MEIKVEKDYQELSRAAADLLVDRIKAKPNLVLGLATGSTPVGLYKELIKKYQAGKVFFKEVTSFNLDEYCGITLDHEQSYRAFMKEYLFDAVDIDQSRTYFPSCEVGEGYDEQIRQAGGIDVQILGIGRNGHIGFNEPGSSFDSRTRLVDLAESTIQDNARFFESIDEVPTRAVTMGLATIMEAREILLLASGEKKKQAVDRMRNGEAGEDVPASILQGHENTIIILDGPAAGT